MREANAKHNPCKTRTIFRKPVGNVPAHPLHGHDGLAVLETSCTPHHAHRGTPFVRIFAARRL
jgi:hypothetical protein